MMSVLAVALTGVTAWLVALYASHGSLDFRWGILSTANDPYLDDSGRTFQKATWHLGIGTRTWGETYGVKMARAYVSVQITHTNPQLTPSEAGEDR